MRRQRERKGPRKEREGEQRRMGGGFFFFFSNIIVFPDSAKPNHTPPEPPSRTRKNVKKSSVRDERKDRKLRMANIIEGQNQLSRIKPEEGELIRTGLGHYRSVCGNSRNVGGGG